jgi:hypothetical protein
VHVPFVFAEGGHGINNITAEKALGGHDTLIQYFIGNETSFSSVLVDEVDSTDLEAANDYHGPSPTVNSTGAASGNH